MLVTAMYTTVTRGITEAEDELTSLVEAARGGDTHACTTLIGRYRRVALAYATARLRDHDAAEDVAQEAFVKALLRLSTLRKPERFGPWLMQLVRHQCEDAARRRKVREALPLDTELLTDRVTPESEVLDADRLKRLSHALVCLPEASRVPMQLFYVSGLSYKEIALALNLSETTVQGRLAQGLRLLRRRLNSEDFLP
jgi:RNA polymerase sigma-70 factor, ECF subfamily